jgi:hypothetical protein
MLAGMADERVSAALRWSGRVLAVGGLLAGMLPSGDCGSGFFPETDLDGAVSAACSGSVSGRQDVAVLLLVLGVAAMIAGQIMGWRKARTDS